MATLGKFKQQEIEQLISQIINVSSETQITLERFYHRQSEDIHTKMTNDEFDLLMEKEQHKKQYALQIKDILDNLKSRG